MKEKDGLLSLAICKPRIRSTAERGDWIFGFAANSLDQDNRLIYIAQVTEKICNGDYYRQKCFVSRADCIYQLHGDKYVWRCGALHHGPEHLVHDLGKPPDYKNISVLLSREFRYFGKEGTAEYKSRYRLLKQAVEGLGRGHRVNCKKALKKELMALKEEVWKKYSKKVLGEPTRQLEHGICHRSRSCGVLE